MLLPILITKLSYKYFLMFKTMIEFFCARLDDSKTLREYIEQLSNFPIVLHVYFQ